MSDTQKVIKILKDNGVTIGEYTDENLNSKKFTGEMIMLNDLPFFLLNTVCEDLLSSQEKMIIFVEQLKELKKSHG